MTKPPWTLAEHGDIRERTWGPTIAANFPSYERLWAKHIVPLTYRVTDPTCVLLRQAVRKGLDELATTSYAVFVHLTSAHAHLSAGEAAFATDGIYQFYSRLYSVRALVYQFLAAVGGVLKLYGGEFISDRERRLYHHGSPDLLARFKEAFDTRTRDYRGQQVHAWGFQVIDGKIPRREHLGKWTRKGRGLGWLDAFLKHPDADDRIVTEFFDPIEQASDDLQFVEQVIEDVWQLVLSELAKMTKKADYEKDQAAGAADLPPTPAPAGLRHPVSGRLGLV